MADAERLVTLKRKLKASMNGTQVMGGYDQRVAKLKAEIAREEADG
jgi:hypothetical protein